MKHQAGSERLVPLKSKASSSYMSALIQLALAEAVQGTAGANSDLGISFACIEICHNFGSIAELFIF